MNMNLNMQKSTELSLIMFNSFSQIFNIPSAFPQRKYQPKPRLSSSPNIVKKRKFKHCKRQLSIFEGILDFLPTPIQHWALQYERVFYNFALHEWIYNEIVSFSTSYKEKQSAGFRQNEMIQQLITEVRLSHSLSLPKFRRPQISLHNIFVLMTQYKVMAEIIYDLNTEELEMMIDGLSFLYFHGVGKFENIGEVLSEEEITMGVGGWGTIDELTCCIHFVTTHTKLYKTYPQKQNYSLMKEIQILQMPYFIKVYDCLQQNKKIDNIVNSIPMFMQFLQIFVKHKNNSLPGCEFVINVKWLSGLGFRIMEIIQYNINKLLLVNNEGSEEFTAQEMEIISQLESVNEQNQKEESQIVVKLTQKALLLKQTEGHISPRILFSYAFHHLYTVNFMIKLTKKVLELSKCHYKVYKQTCQNVCKFLLKLFECNFKFDFTLPQSSIQQICDIIKTISNEGEYQFGLQEREVRGYDFLYHKEINSSQLKEFAKNLQRSQRFGCYFNHKPRPKLASSNDMLGEQIAEDYNVMLEVNEQSIFYYVMSSVYSMKMDYLAIIYTVLKYADKRCLQMLQFFFIKNELVHFLVESEHEVQLKDKKNTRLLYNTLGYLLKGNLVAYAIVDQLIAFEVDEISQKSEFIEDLKKNFSQTKQLLLIVLSDNITVNNKYYDKYSYCPLMLQKLLYPTQEQLQIDTNTSTKHEVWISYIFNVILHEIFGFRKKIEEIEKKKRKIEVHRYENLIQNIILVKDNQPKNQFDHEIYDWITLILFLHIDYTQDKKNFKGTVDRPSGQDDEIILAKFVMAYLSSILSEAIKWKYKNESERMVEFMKCLQDWENHYTDLILTQQNNEDLIEKEYGGVIKFLYLKRWNKKIIKAIKLYLQTMEDYNVQMRNQKRTLQRVRSLKILRH